MDWAALKSEVTSDPNTRGYNQMSDHAVFDDLTTVYQANAPTRINKLKPSQLLNWAAKAGRLQKLKNGAEDAQLSDTVRGLCSAAVSMISLADPEADLDLNLQDHVDHVNGLVAAGVWTQADADDLTALATEEITRAEELGFVGLKVGHVSSVR